MITFRDLVVARTQGPDVVSEASLLRAYQHVQQAKEKSFAMITAFLDPNRAEEMGLQLTREQLAQRNNKEQKRLQQMVGSGSGYTILYGMEKLPDGTEKVEPTLFVYGITKEKLLSLIKEFKQRSALYAGPDTDGEVVDLKADGVEVRIGKFTPGKVGQYYSRVKGRPFVFETEGGVGCIEGMAETKEPVTEEEILELDLKLKSTAD
jgi:hypothetical protein